VHHLTLKEIQGAIRESGYIPRQRNVFYGYIDHGPEALARVDKQPVKANPLPILN
jgi:cyclic dehypoxanthinyl futalosine synthase